MKTLITITFIMLLSACSLTDEIPSFYDDNESKAIIDLSMSVRSINCKSQLVPHHVNAINKDLEWLKTYTELKGTKDVYSLLLIIDETVDGLQKKKTISATYCELKKKNLIKQTDAAAKAIFGRY